MQISPKFNLVLSNKVANNGQEKQSYITKINNQNDTFESSKNTSGQVSFKAAKAPEKVIEMLKSNSYWKVLGATVAATAAAIWSMLANAGIKDENITEDTIADFLKNFVPQQPEDAVVVDVEPTKKTKKQKAKKDKETVEVIVEQKPNTEVDEAEEAVIVEVEKVENVEKKKRGRKKKITTVELKDGKQPVDKSVKTGRSEKYKKRVEVVKKYAEDGYSQVDIVRLTGIPEPTVSRIVNNEKIVTKKIKRKNELADVSTEKIQKVFDENPYSSKQDIAVMLGISVQELDKICEKRGISPFKQRDKKELLNEETINAHIAEGLTNAEIAAKYNLPVSDVRKILKEYGIKNPNIKEKTTLTREMIAQVKELREQKLTIDEIAQKMGIAPISVSRILDGTISTKYIDIKELAEQGYTVQEIAEKLGMKERGVKMLVTKYKIAIKEPQTKQVEPTLKLDDKDIKLTNDPSIFKNIPSPEKLFFAQPFIELDLDENAKQVIENIRKEYEKTIKNIELLEAADYEKRSKKLVKLYMKAGLVSQENGANASKSPIRYSSEDLFERYIAKCYHLLLAQKGEDGVQNFIDKTKEPRMILNGPSVKLDTHVLRLKDEPIPQKDELFERFKECYDKRAIVLQIEALKLKYYGDFAETLKKTKLIDALKNANTSHIQPSPRELFNIICYPEFPPVATVKIPNYKNPKEGTNETQEHLMESIEQFRQITTVKEYIKLIDIYNEYCGMNFDAEIADKILDSFSMLDDPKNISIPEMQDFFELIKEYLEATKSVGVTVEVEEDMAEKYQKMDFEQLIQELDNYYGLSNSNEEMSVRITDFYNNANAETDLEVLRKFLTLLSDVKANNMTVDKANEICSQEKLLPKNSDLDSWLKQLDKEETVTQVYGKLNNVLGKIKDEKSIIVKILKDFCDSEALKSTTLENLKIVNTELDTIDSLVKFEPDKVEAKLLTVANLILGEENASELIRTATEDAKAQQMAKYTKILDGKTELDNHFENFVRVAYQTKGVSKDDAINCLKIVEKYNELSDVDKTRMTTIRQLFGKEMSKFEKDLISEIIEEDYLKTDTVIFNEGYQKDFTISSEVKKCIWEEYKESEVFEVAEKATTLKATGYGTPGVKDLSIVNKKPEHSFELKLYGNRYGSIRLYSSFEIAPDGHKIRKDVKTGQVIKRYRFDVFDPQHSKYKS